MAFAYILIKCRTGFENLVIENLLKLPQVREVHGILGEYDIFVKLESDSKETLRDTLQLKIRKIPNIISTNSLFPIRSQGGR